MTRTTENKLALIEITMTEQNSICPICNKKFKKITEYNCSGLEAHHQTIKTETISEACNSSLGRALTEFINGSCIWVHSDCHAIMHKMTKTGDDVKTYEPITIDDISYGKIKEIRKQVKNLR